MSFALPSVECNDKSVIEHQQSVTTQHLQNASMTSSVPAIYEYEKSEKILKRAAQNIPSQDVNPFSHTYESSEIRKNPMQPSETFQGSSNTRIRFSDLTAFESDRTQIASG